VADFLLAQEADINAIALFLVVRHGKAGCATYAAADIGASSGGIFGRCAPDPGGRRGERRPGAILENWVWHIGEHDFRLFADRGVTRPRHCRGGNQAGHAAKWVIQDFPSSFTLPPIKLDQSLPPVIGKLDAKTADAFRAVVQQSFPQLLLIVDKMAGIEATMLLIAERQTPPNPTVGGTIVEHALQAGRRSTILISDAELRGMVFPSRL
jgi:hypothetical protein